MSIKIDNNIYTVLGVYIQRDRSEDEDLLTGQVIKQTRENIVFIRVMKNYNNDMKAQETLIYPYSNFMKYYNSVEDKDLMDRLVHAAYLLIKAKEIDPYTYQSHHKEPMVVDKVRPSSENNIQDT